MYRYTSRKRLQKLNPSSKSIRGATECSTAHKALKIYALPTVSAIVINDVPHVLALEKLLQLSQN